MENLHWIDTETQACLDSLVESLPTAHLLLLVTYRPEYQHAWGHKTYYTQLRLDPLPHEHIQALLDALLGDEQPGAPSSVCWCGRKETPSLWKSVQSLIETGGVVGEPGAYRLGTPSQTLPVPATVQAVLAARIDRLPAEAKHLLQTAAVIGTEVPVPLLQAVAELDEERLHQGLAQLQAAEFLYETWRLPERAYTFKHALTQEVAYGSLVQGRRRALHARIVEALEALAGDRLDDQVERLAQHALRGEVWDKAWRTAGRRGTKPRRARPPRGGGVLRAGAQRPPASAETRDTLAQAIDLRLALRSALRLLGDFGRVLAYLREAESLAAALDDQHRLGQVSVFYQSISSSWARMTRPSPLASAPWRSPRLAAMPSYRRWRTSTSGSLPAPGRLSSGHRLPQAGRGVLRRGAAARALWSPSYPPCCPVPTSPSAMPSWARSLGHALGEEGLRIAEAVVHPRSLENAYRGIGLLFLRQGDLHGALPIRTGRGPLSRSGSRPCSPAAVVLGAAYTLAGRVADAVALLTRDGTDHRNGKVGPKRTVVSP